MCRRCMFLILYFELVSSRFITCAILYVCFCFQFRCCITFLKLYFLLFLFLFFTGNIWYDCDELCHILEILASISSVLLFWWYIHVKLQIPYAKSKKVEAWKNNPMDDKWWLGGSSSKLQKFVRAFIARVSSSRPRLGLISCNDYYVHLTIHRT